jgi:HD-GYP domain-containing protein (c-di-GMP phosphodiesterase class II)
MAILIVERGPDAGKKYSAVTFPVTIGRDPSNTVVLSDAEISRFHLRIKKRDRLYIAEDLGSKNGSILNGDRLVNATLQNGDKLLVGNTLLLFINSVSETDISGNPDSLGIEIALPSESGSQEGIQLSDISDGTSTRLPPLLPGTAPTSNKLFRAIFEISANLATAASLEEASAILLKSIYQLQVNCSRGSIFSWSAREKLLTPRAVRQFHDKRPLTLSRPDLEGTVSSKSGFLRLGDESKNLPALLLLPIIHNDQVMGIICLESDHSPGFLPDDIALIQLLIMRSAPSLETLHLRRELDYWMIGMIETIVAIIEAKDTYTHGHSERVSRFSAAIADELHLSRDLKRMLIISALCHDIGKVGVPDAILKKASILSADEYDEMKIHPVLGAEIIQHVPNAQRFISGIKYHHEKWDGTGYPEGLSGEDIPFFGRIVAIADVYDAMVSGRSYSGFVDQDSALEKLDKEKELFDPEIFKAFQKAHDKGTLTLKTTTQANQPAAKPDEPE